MLSSNTKAFRSYGKSRSHVVASSVDWISASTSHANPRPTTPALASDSDSETPDSASESEPETKLDPKQKKALALEALRAKRNAKINQQQQQARTERPPPTPRAGAKHVDKENHSTYRTAPSPRKKAQVVVYIPPKRKSSPIATHSRPVLGKKHVGNSVLKKRPTPVLVLDSTTEEEEEAPKLRLPVLRNRSRALQVIDSESEVEDTTRSKSTFEDVELDAEESEHSQSDSPSSLPGPSSTSQHKSTKEQLRSELETLLSSTLSSSILDFTSFVQNPPSPFPRQKRHNQTTNSHKWSKIGEASYSEVFKYDGDGEMLVIKIIPITLSSGKEGTPEVGAEDWPDRSRCDSVKREIEVGQLVGGVGALDGFVKFKGAFIVKGSYPTLLLQKWDDFKSAQYPACDDQIRPHVFPSSQMYAIICLEHGGTSLEDFKLVSWKEAISVFWQVATICAKAEKEVAFEHRDLHVGNILVQRTDVDEEDQLDMSSLSLGRQTGTPSTSRKQTSWNAQSTGITATLIDFTLSRANRGKKEVIFDPLAEKELFEGEGEYQYDIYRMMKQHMAGEWQGFHPLTNLMWLHYLTVQLLHFKKLKPPSPPKPTAGSQSTPTRPSSPALRRLRTPIRGSTRHTAPTVLPRPSLQTKEEVVAYTTLKEVEQKLRNVLESKLGKKVMGMGFGAASSSRKKGATMSTTMNMKGRGGKKTDLETWESAEDFGAWWNERERSE